MRITPVLAATALALAGCGSDSADQAAGASAAETVFRSYHQALLARDFTTACGLNAPEAAAELVRSVNGAHSCPEALGTLFATPTVAQRYDAVSRSARVQGVRVDAGSAVVTWTYDGAQRPVDTGLRRIDGQWRLLDVNA